MKPLVYVAGPYSNPDPVVNTAAAISVATELLDSDLVAPLVPHLTMLWHFQAPHDYEVWLALDSEHLRRCDALLRIPGESAGADHEMWLAKELRLPVFHDVDACLLWAEDQWVGA